MREKTAISRWLENKLAHRVGPVIRNTGVNLLGLMQTIPGYIHPVSQRSLMFIKAGDFLSWLSHNAFLSKILFSFDKADSVSWLAGFKGCIEHF